METNEKICELLKKSIVTDITRYSQGTTQSLIDKLIRETKKNHRELMRELHDLRQQVIDAERRTAKTVKEFTEVD